MTVFKLKTDSEKLRLLADWFDNMQDLNKFPEWSDSREVQEDLRRIADNLDYYSLAQSYDDGRMRMGI